MVREDNTADKDKVPAGPRATSSGEPAQKVPKTDVPRESLGTAPPPEPKDNGQDDAASGSSAAPRAEAEGENSRQVAAHEPKDDKEIVEGAEEPSAKRAKTSSDPVKDDLKTVEDAAPVASAPSKAEDDESSYTSEEDETSEYSYYSDSDEDDKDQKKPEEICSEHGAKWKLTRITKTTIVGQKLYDV